jgi:hypothetical protein
MLRFLKTIAGENLSRWKSLKLRGRVDDRWTPVLRQVLLPAREMTSLEHISLYYQNCHMLFPAFSARVPRLSSLDLTLKKGAPPTVLLDQLWLRRLKTLTLRNCLQLSPLGSFMAECKALEELNLIKSYYSPFSGESYGSSGWYPLPCC